MNYETTQKIKQLAIDGGLKHTTEIIAGKTVDNYEGRLIVSFYGDEYLVVGRKARQHKMSITNGHVSISRRTICTGLKSC